MADYIVNEVLCVLVNNFGKHLVVTLLQCSVNFTPRTRLSKQNLYCLSLQIKLNSRADQLKKIKPRVGDGKIRRDTKEVSQVYTILDARKVQMLCFLAADTGCIPTYLLQCLEHCRHCVKSQ